MAEQVAAVTLQVDGSQAVSSMAEMRQQIQQANDKLIQMVTTYGEASAEAAAAAGEVAALRDQLDAANQLTAAMNPDAPFAALGGAVQGVIGGFTAAQGAMATFGLESKAAEDVIAGLEGAMALQSGVEGIMASVESFRTLGAVLKQNTVIQRIMNFVTQGQFVTTAALTGATTAQATAETANAVATEASAVATTEQAVASGTAAAATTAQTAATVGSTTAMSAARIAAIALRGALMLIGIGALIIGIVALIKVIQDWTDESKEQEKQIAKSRKEYDDLNKSLEDNGTQFDKNQKHQLAMAKASGASAEAIRKLELKLADEKIAYEQSALAIAKQTAEKARNYLQTLKNADADEEQLNKQQAVVDDFTKLEQEKTQAVANAVEARKDIERQHEVDIKQAETDRRNKSREDAKKAAEDRKQQAEKDRADRKKEAEERQKEIDNESKASAERTKKLEEENYLASIQDEQKRADAKLQIDYENAIKALNQSKATEEQKAKELEAINAKFLLDKAALEEKARKDKETKDKEAADKEKALRDKALKVEQDTFEIAFQARMAREQNEFVRRQEEEALRYQKELDNLYVLLNNKEITQQDFDTRYAAYKSNNELNIQKIAEDSAKAQDEIDRKRQETRQQIAEQASATINKFADVVGRQTAAGKALAIASATMDTYSAANKALNANYGIFGPFAQVARFASVAATILTGIKNIKEIAKAKVPGAAGGNVPNASSVSAAVGAPLSVQASTTMLDQNQVNQMASATARAFVVESDVSGNQERIRRLNRAARIN